MANPQFRLCSRHAEVITEERDVAERHFIATGSSLRTLPHDVPGAFENATTGTIAADLCEKKTAAGDSNGPGVEARFKRRSRIGVIAAEARRVCVLFFSPRKKNLSRS